MRRRKKILFIPALFYLSNPLFLSILQHLKNYETIYLDCDYINRKFSKNYSQEINQIRPFFSDVRIIEDTESATLEIQKNPFTSLWYYCRKRGSNNQILKTVRDIHPELIILTSDRTYVYRFMLHYFPSVPVLMVQQGALQPPSLEQTAPRLKSKIRYSLLEKLFHYPTLPKNPWKTSSADTTNCFRAYWSKFWVFHNENQKPLTGIHYTGNASMDNDIIYGNERLQKNEDYHWHIPRIVYTTQPISEHHGTWKRDKLNQLFLDFVDRRRQSKVIIKVHPREDISYYKKLFESSDHQQITILKEGDLSSLLKEVELLVTGWSMTSYQAVAMGVPVIAMNPETLFNFEKIYPKTGIPVVTSVDEFTSAYDRLTTQNGLKKFAGQRGIFLKEINTFSDGKSASHLAKLIMDILDGTIKT